MVRWVKIPEKTHSYAVFYLTTNVHIKVVRTAAEHRTAHIQMGESAYFSLTAKTRTLLDCFGLYRTVNS